MELWTAVQAATYLQLNVEVVRRKARTREVPAVKLGGVWRFQPERLRQWVDSGCPDQREQPSLFE